MHVVLFLLTVYMYTQFNSQPFTLKVYLVRGSFFWGGLFRLVKQV